MSSTGINISINELLLGRQYRRGRFMYPSTEELVGPYLTKLENVVTEFKIKVIEPEEGSGINKVQDKTYKRVWIQGMLPNKQQNHIKTIGLLYGLDTQNPLMKLYSGWENQACLNLSIFNPKRLNVAHLASEEATSIFDNIESYLDEIEEEERELSEAIQFLTSQSYSGDSLNEKLGALARNCLTTQGLGSSYTNLVNFLENSHDRNGIRNIYYREDKSYTGWDMYQAMTATPSAKSLDPTREVIEIYKMFL